jgi:hypothetical protein
MGKDHLGDFDTFYQELPAANNDYLSGFDTEIEDLVEEAPQREGLNADQVSRLAQDTRYGKEIIRRSDTEDDSSEPSLFKEDEA